MAEGEVTCSLLRRGAGEAELLLADGQVAAVQNLRRHIHAVLDLEGNEIGLSVLQFIKRRLLAGRTADIGKYVVVVDRGNQKRLAGELRVGRVIKMQLG